MSLDSPDFSLTAAQTVDQDLVRWLQELNVDSVTIQTVRDRVLATPDLYQPKTPPLPIFQLFSLFPSDAENLNLNIRGTLSIPLPL